MGGRGFRGLIYRRNKVEGSAAPSGAEMLAAVGYRAEVKTKCGNGGGNLARKQERTESWRQCSGISAAETRCFLRFYPYPTLGGGAAAAAPRLMGKKNYGGV